jgi:hypothetical protein
MENRERSSKLPWEGGHIEFLRAALNFRRGINRLTKRERDPDKLLTEACALLVRIRGYLRNMNQENSVL